MSGAGGREAKWALWLIAMSIPLRSRSSITQVATVRPGFDTSAVTVNPAIGIGFMISVVNRTS
jgi:hypothetical protein